MPSNTDQRDALRSKVLSAQARNAARKAADARDNAADFVAAHPFSSLAGAVAVGIVLGSMLPSSTGRKLGKGALGVITFAAKIGASYAQHAWSAAREAKETASDRIEDLDETIMDSAAGLRHDVKRIAEKAGDSSRNAGRAVTRRATRMADLISSRTRH